MNEQAIPTACDLLISGGIVLTVDAERRIFMDGALAIQGNRILEVGRRIDLEPRYRATRVIDARDKVITPGMIDARPRLAEQCVKGVLADTMPPSQWVRQVTQFYAAMTPAEEALNATFTFLELIRTGTTAFIEAGTTKHTPEVVDAIGRSGIRGCIGKWSSDITPASQLYQSTQDAIDTNEALIKQFHGAHNDRVRIWTSPIGHTMTSDELLQGLKALADRYQTA